MGMMGQGTTGPKMPVDAAVVVPLGTACAMAWLDAKASAVVMASAARTDRWCFIGSPWSFDSQARMALRKKHSERP